MANKILAVLEQREGTIKKVSFEVASTAAKLSKELNLDVEAVVAGAEVSNINEVSKYGISKLVHLKIQNSIITHQVRMLMFLAATQVKLVQHI